MKGKLVSYSVGFLVLIVAGAGALIAICGVASRTMNAYIASSLPSLEQASPPARAETRNGNLLPGATVEAKAEPQSEIAPGETAGNRAAENSEFQAVASSRRAPEHGGFDIRRKEPVPPEIKLPRLDGDVYVEVEAHGRKFTFRPFASKQTEVPGRIKDWLDDLQQARLNGVKASEVSHAASRRAALAHRMAQIRLRTVRDNIHVGESGELL